MGPVVFPPLYGWKLAHIQKVIHANEVVLHSEFLFQPSDLFTRMLVLGANKPIQLSIPVCRSEKGALLPEIRIDYNQKWQNQHWRTLTSAYGKSPFFEYYESELFALFQLRPEYLIDFTGSFSLWLTNQYRRAFRLSPAKLALPGSLNIGKSASLSELGLSEADPSPFAYQQVFGKEFVTFLGVLDHLFCVGPRFWNFQN